MTRRQKAITSRIGKILYEARVKKGYSQQMVATKAGVSIRVYQRLEYGERCFYTVNFRLGTTICSILDINPFDLIFPMDG